MNIIQPNSVRTRQIQCFKYRQPIIDACDMQQIAFLDVVIASQPCFAHVTPIKDVLKTPSPVSLRADGTHGCVGFHSGGVDADAVALNKARFGYEAEYSCENLLTVFQG
jgi:hypothetical protein